MKKAYLWMLLPLAALVACEPTNQPEVPGNGGDQNQDSVIVIPESFPKKHLIEHFTGEACIYCPSGMEAIEEMVGTDTNFIWVSHHAGYQKDEYTIAESNTLVSKFNVEGAPAMMLDRKAQDWSFNYNGKKYTDDSKVFSPGGISDLACPLENTTYASVVINHTFDAATGELSVTASGLVADTTIKQFLLTVLLEENKLIDTQADAYDTVEGWSEFRHNKVVRTFLTAATGDPIAVKKQQYSATFTGKLTNIADANNCVVVAYITPNNDNEPVINAEQTPLVKGTTGGEEYKFEGIKAVEVPADYPEEGAPMSPMSVTATVYQLQAGLYGIQVEGSQSVTVSGYACTPVALVYVISQNLAEGVYPISGTMGNNTVWAGYRDDENFSLEGSALYYAENSYLQQGYIYPFAIWLIANGNMTIGANNTISFEATTLNGSTLQMSGTFTMGSLNAPAKKNTFAPLRLSEQMTPADMPARKYSLFSNL